MPGGIPPYICCCGGGIPPRGMAWLGFPPPIIGPGGGIDEGAPGDA
jgi:hypothetical protein